jgi:hypothetical protein
VQQQTIKGLRYVFVCLAKFPPSKRLFTTPGKLRRVFQIVRNPLERRWRAMVEPQHFNCERISKLRDDFCLNFVRWYALRRIFFT